ncbi:MAG: hypothetical protein WBM40_20450, partial [Thiohalocapsa sp.]
GRISGEELAELFDAIGNVGFGRDASIGLGKFTLHSLAEPWPAPSSAQAAANACLTLAPCATPVWLAASDIQQRTEMLPFDWVLVAAVPVGKTLPGWPSSLRDTLTAQTGAESDALDRRITERQAPLRAAAEEQRAREQQRAQEAAQAQEEKQAKAARLANLSPEQHTIKELRQRLAEDRAAGRKAKGGELDNQLATVLKQAEQAWSGPDCAEQVDLAEEIHGFIGWPASKKKQARKDQIAANRAKA